MSKKKGFLQYTIWFKDWNTLVGGTQGLKLCPMWWIQFFKPQIINKDMILTRNKKKIHIYMWSFRRIDTVIAIVAGIGVGVLEELIQLLLLSLVSEWEHSYLNWLQQAVPREFLEDLRPTHYYKQLFCYIR